MLRLYTTLAVLNLTPSQHRVLQAMRDGATLKVHRTLDGEKIHRLHPLDGEPEAVDGAIVRSLITQGLIQSNLKFPASTYVLTEDGVQALAPKLQK